MRSHLSSSSSSQGYCGQTHEAPGLAATAAKGLRVLEAGLDEATAGCAGDAVGMGAVLEVRWAERHRLLQEPLRTVLERVQTELGSTLDLLQGPADAVLLLVRAQKVVACVVREAVSPRQLVSLSLSRTSVDVDITTDAAAARPGSSSPPPSGATVSAAEQGQGGDTEEEKVRRPHGDTLGIKLVWVHDKCRRSGVASRILDTARRTFEFGRTVKKEHVAYSQPTEAGLNLFLAYSKQDSIWGYC